MKVYVVTQQTVILAVCLTYARAERVVLSNPDGVYSIQEHSVDTGNMLLQPVVMRHYSGAPEQHLARDTEQSAREWAAHLRRKESKGAHYYAALIVPLEPVT